MFQVEVIGNGKKQILPLCGRMTTAKATTAILLPD
jgi:hypothetical protein